MPAQPEKFPDDVIVALHTAGVTVSCVPVQFDHRQWQAAVFFVLAADAPCLGKSRLPPGPFAVELDADLHEHSKGTVVEIGIDIATPVEHCRGTMLFITGHSKTHFETLSLLVEQAELPVFLGDEYCNVLYRQRVPLNDSVRAGLKQLLDEAVGRDAVIRMTGHYEPEAAFEDVVASLQLT